MMSADTALAAPRGHQFINRGSSIGLLLVALPVLLLAWLIVYPIFSAVVGTIFVRGPDGATDLTFASYSFFFTDGYSLANLWMTLWTTAICGILLLMIGFPIALYLRFSQGRLVAYVQALAIFPMFVPSIILAYALIRTIGPNGTVDLLLNAVGLPKLRTPYMTPWGPVIGLVWDNLPLTVLMLTAGLSAVSNSAVEAPATSAQAHFGSSSRSSCRAWAIPCWSPHPLPCSASSRPSRFPMCSARHRRR